MSTHQKKHQAPIAPANGSAAAVAVPVNAGSAIHIEGLTDLAVRNPAPDASPSRAPTGTYRVVSFE